MTVLDPVRRALAPLRLLEALTTPHAVDRYLELVSPRLTVRELRATVVDVRRTTADSVTLTLRPTRQWRGFRAGQFVQLTVDIDGVRHTRCYSPTSSQHRADGLLELCVTAHPDGQVSRYLRDSARAGMVVGLSQADGTFTLPDERPDRVLLISGGSGITPALSMLRTLADEGHQGEVTLVHYTPHRGAMAHREDVERLAAAHPSLRLVVVETRADAPGEHELSGHFGEHHLDAVAPWHSEAETFVCGPAGLMTAVRECYDDRGLSHRLHTEQFTLPSLVGSAPEAGGTVNFTRSGRTADNSGASLLEQAEAAGLTPDYGCRMGICFTCTAVRTGGCTRDLRTGEVDADPDVEIQLCVSAPVGDVSIDL